jgi:hypothetical protein
MLGLLYFSCKISISVRKFLLPDFEVTGFPVIPNIWKASDWQIDARYRFFLQFLKHTEFLLNSAPNCFLNGLECICIPADRIHFHCKQRNINSAKIRRFFVNDFIGKRF